MAIYFELEDFHLSDYWDYFSTNRCCLQGGRVEDYQTIFSESEGQNVSPDQSIF